MLTGPRVRGLNGLVPTEPLRPLLDYARRLGGAGDSAPDRELLGRFVGGDAGAFEHLVRRHGPMVRGICRRMLRDPHTADDAFQATFLLLVRKARGLRQPEKLGPWLHGVAVRVCLKARERFARRREQPAATEPAAVADTDTVDWRPVLDAAIGRLPARERDAVVMCYFDGLTYAEAAERLRCPLGTLASHLARARERLRDRLVRQGLGPPAVLFPLADAAERVGPDLLATTVAAAASLGAGSKVGVSASVLALVEGVRRAMFIHYAKIALATSALLGVAGTGVGVLVSGQGPGAVPAKAPATTPPVAADSPPVPPADAPPAARDVPLALLKKPTSSAYLVQPGDVLGIYVEGVLGKAGEAPPIIPSQPASTRPNLPPSVGYPIAVSDAGVLTLPLVGPLAAANRSVAEVENLIRTAYLEKNILVRGKEKIIVSLAQPRPIRVTVFRPDLQGFEGHEVDLAQAECDVLSALIKTGGMPKTPIPNGYVVLVQRRDHSAGSRAGIVKEVRIPLRLQPGEAPPTADEVQLQAGDVVTVKAIGADSPRTTTPPITAQPPALTHAILAPGGRVLLQVKADGSPPWITVAVASLTAQETDGKLIPAADLAERLKSMTVVVYAADGQVPAPALLTAVKPGTPVIVKSGQ